ncbi:putative hemicentin-1-like [Triplophysa rosa]|uniref:Hemicentin-1-like n=1 Tax=Triplophysa rosa TaxID=992332 RepID=A0A9W7X0P4_TRIRA|nr:putative hemicentin-1-like [Triplophysa rosa]
MSLHHGAPADILCQKFNPSRGETLQVFKNIQNKSYKLSCTMILDTNVSLDIIPDVLRSRVVNNGSLIHFSDVSAVDSGLYSCVVWRDNQCQNVKETSLDVKNQDIFLEPKQSFTLSCLAKDVKPESMLAWWYPVGLNLPGLKSEYDQSEMLNDTQTGNYSLVIPHVTLNHTGTYTCRAGQKYYNVVNIFVCSDLEPINMTFSLGDVAYLKCHPHLTETLRVQWYREYDQSSKYLLTDTHGGFVNEKMKNRLMASNAQSYITILELLITDGGSYWCRVWGIRDVKRGLCFKRRVHLTYVGDYEGTFYMVYASLMASMLLGMIITVVCVTVLSRKRRPPV